MIELLNHYSYAIAGAIAITAVGWWAFQRRTVAALVILLALAATIVGVDVALRGDSSVASVAEFDRATHAGRPTLVEFYSNY